MELLNNQVLLLFFVIISGELLGKIEFKSFSLGSSAIIFVALLMGHFGFSIGKDFQTFGLVLFIYSIGLQAGPGFFSSFKSQGLNLTLGAFFLVTLGFLTTLAVSYYQGYDSGMAAGIFSGALTSSPGLAVAVELTEGDMAAAAYGVTYSFGVIGVILFIKLIPQIMKIDLKKEEQLIRDELEAENPTVAYHHLEVTNPNLFNKQVKDIKLSNLGAVVITRILKPGTKKAELVTATTILEEGDKLRIVGTEEDLEKVHLYIGKRIEDEIKFKGDLTRKKILVSKKEVIGKTLRSFNIRNLFNVQVSRLTRNGIDLPADQDIRLKMGDKLQMVGEEGSLNNLSKLLGNDIKRVYGTDVLSIIIGIFLGFLVGKIPLIIPFVGTIYLGTTGGTLLTGLFLGYLYSTGPVLWAIPTTGNSLIRELGLMMFLATVGTRAGSSIIATIQKQGVELLFSGILVTLIPLIIGYMFCHYVLKIRFLRILGVLTGGMTSTPGLASTTSLSNTSYASSAYASVYPAALIGMIIFTKLLVGIFDLLL